MTQTKSKQTQQARRPLALERGLALYAGGNLNAARVTLEAVLVDHPACLEALNALGMLHLELTKVETAYFYFSRALRLDGGNGALLMQVSECQRALGDVAGADESYERAMRFFNAPVALPPVEVVAAPYDVDGYETFLEGIQLPMTSLTAVPMTRDRGTQPLWMEPWMLPGTANLKTA
ncbi:MAG: hypothetical protein JWM80_4598 [Cyanobacteria bacterium RYN_339]|nr:hypothetical protein [Cyanobacteria bacterium RYN_339]